MLFDFDRNNIGSTQGVTSNVSVYYFLLCDLIYRHRWISDDDRRNLDYTDILTKRPYFNKTSKVNTPLPSSSIFIYNFNRRPIKI